MRALHRNTAWLSIVAGASLLLTLEGAAPGGGPCGIPGESCCTMGPQCSPAAVCQMGMCVACGGAMQPCCPPSNFCSSPSTVCAGGTCQPCGMVNQLCCDSDPPDDCELGTLCSGNMCVRCGQNGDPCCTEGPACNINQVCSMGTCEDCGSLGEPCCQVPISDFCLGSNVVCRLDECVACGGDGQPCCRANDCAPPAECGPFQNCTTCGFPMQPSCTPTPTRTATPTRTPTSTPTLTPTNTPKPNGADCTDPSVCASGFCVDGFCCDTACDDPLERCDALEPGTCTSFAAPAPALSWRGLLIAAFVLVATATVALWRRRRSVT